MIVVALTREMAPFMTALILSAAVGSAMAAEIGTMTVSEEIDALEVMSINPIRYLVLPRVVGFSLMTPVLSNYASLLGVLGGALVATTVDNAAVSHGADVGVRTARDHREARCRSDRTPVSNTAACSRTR